MLNLCPPATQVARRCGHPQCKWRHSPALCCKGWLSGGSLLPAEGEPTPGGHAPHARCLFLLASCGASQVAPLLCHMQAGANPCVHNKEGLTPLSAAACSSTGSMVVQMLLRHIQSDDSTYDALAKILHAADAHGNTALMYAARYGEQR